MNSHNRKKWKPPARIWIDPVTGAMCDHRLSNTFFLYRLDERRITKAELRREMEGYRRIAFPSGGAKTIRTRDQQNHALVARGGYFAIQRLLESLTLDQIEPPRNE